MAYINGAVYTSINVQDMQVKEKLNQVPVGRVTLDLTTSSRVVIDGGNVLILDQVNNLPWIGYVQIGEEIIKYNQRTWLNSLTRLEEEYEAWENDPEGYTPAPPSQFVLALLTRGWNGTPQGTHPAGTRVIISPPPAEGDDIEIYLGGRLLLTGVVSDVEKDESAGTVSVECVGIATRIRDLQVTSKTLHQEKLTGEILQSLKPPGDNWWVDIDTGLKMNYRMELGNNLMHLANLCVLSGFDWWVSSYDNEHIIHCRARRGSPIPLAEWTARLSALELSRSASKDGIYNSITAIGSSQEMQGASTTLNADTIRITRLTTSESTLTNNPSASSTTLSLVSAASYVVGSTIQVEAERMLITGKTGNNLTVTRAQGGTAAVAHHVGDPALMITALGVASTSDLDKGLGHPTAVWIGSEKIGLTGGIYGGNLQNLVRGLDGTTPYAHRAGTLVLAHVDDPEGTSSIGFYGVRGMRQSVIGVADLDGLDKWAGSVLMELKDLLPGGSFRVPLASFPTEMGVGDAFTLKEYGVAGSSIHRISGLTWDLSGAVKVQFGHPEEWILADFADAARAMQLATQKTPPSALAPIIQVSDDKKMVQIQGPDGLVWVRVNL